MAHNPQGIPKTYEYEMDALRPISGAYAAIQTDDGTPIPCRYISVGTTGAYTLTNPDGTTQIITLNSGILHPITTKTALAAGAGVSVYWY